MLHRAAKTTPWGIVSLGSSDGAVREAMDRLADDGIDVDYLRLRAFPFGAELQPFLDEHECVFVVEQNRDAQLKALLTLETAVDKRKLVSILHYNGAPIDCVCIFEAIAKELEQRAAV